jgi:hypothetical protein
MTHVNNKVILYVAPTFWIGAKGYNLFKYDVSIKKWSFFSKIKDKKNAILSSFFLTRRLFRAEITHLYKFQHNVWMCIAKKGIFRYNNTSGLFEKCSEIERGSRPMCLCQANDGTIYYGEYYYNPQRKSMRIFQSKNHGDSWDVAYSFADGEINHIHGIFQDPYSNKLWVATGDDDKACIFGYTEDGFKTFVRAFEGSQQYRVCVPLFTEKEIIFATDSQYEQNFIRSINCDTDEIKDLCPIQGSGIYGTQNGNLMMISTTVEPSTVNLDRHSHLWYSFDGHVWQELCSYAKDIFPATYFQFGSIRFPNYEGECDYLVYSGRALKKIDQRSVFIKVKDLKI